MKCLECQECQEKITQLDLFSSKHNEVVGCKKLTKKEWDLGLKDTLQSNCPIKDSKVL